MSTVNHTKVRVEAAVLSLKRFTVDELCGYTGILEAEVKLVLADLQKHEYITSAEIAAHEGAPVVHSSQGQYQVTTDKFKLRSLANQVYQQSRVPRTWEGGEEGDLRQIQAAIEHLELLLDICDSATASRDLTLKQLQKVELEVREIYLQLESATYKRVIDLLNPKNDGHPIVAIWNRWRTCSALLKQIADQWNIGTHPSRATTIITTQVCNINKLQVVTDPRFIDSALFLWIFHQQPFREAGLAIECILVPKEWISIPGFVAEHTNAIGFYNSSIAENIGYWIDLCVYCGYALLAHRNPQLGLMNRPRTLQETENFLLKFIAHWHNENCIPTIISIGGDTDWRFKNLTPKVGRQLFQDEIIQNADKALEQFRGRPNALFVGGLPQRLRAEKDGFIPIIDINHQPTLYSINGIIYNRKLYHPEGQALLQNAASLWFNTVSRMKRNKEFRERVATDIQNMLSADYLRTSDSKSQVSFQSFMFNMLFDSENSEKLELFPTTPAAVTQAIANIQTNCLRKEIHSAKSSDIATVVNDVLKKTSQPYGNPSNRMGIVTPEKQSIKILKDLQPTGEWH